MDEKYMLLINRFPLLPIRGKEDHESAKGLVTELTLRDGQLTDSEIGYGKVLVQLIQAYEQKLLTEYFEDVSGNQALEYLLDEHGMRQTDAAGIAGVSKQNMNDFLKGRRGLSREARARLAKHFKLTPAVFELSRELSSA